MRNLTNCLVGGVFAGLLVTQALFLLNPDVRPDPASGYRIIAALTLAYGIVVGLGFWLILLVLEELLDRRIRPAWLSYRLLTWLLTIDLAGAAALAWHNLFYYRLYLPSVSIRAMALSATVFSAAAGVLLFLALFRYSFGRRAAWWGYPLVLTAAACSIALPFVFRPTPAAGGRPVPRLPLEDAPSARRLTLIGIEGASMSYILPAIAEGRLPGFARWIQEGASGALKTLYPTESLAVWTSIATGKLPRQHGLHGFYRYRSPLLESSFALLPHGAYLRGLERTGLLRRTAMTSTQRRTHAFWSVLSQFGIRVGLVRWWGTYPAESVDGFVVSELFHRQVRERFEPPLPRLCHPPELADEIASWVVLPEDVDPKQLERYVDPAVEAGDHREWESTLRRAIADDTTYYRIARRLRERYHPQVFALYLFGLDVLGHDFLRYHLPERFGDVSDPELNKYGRVIDAYYDRLDTMVGEILASRQPDEILILLSGHGMEPLPLARRIWEGLKGNTHLSGYHDDAPDGMLAVYGPGIARGAKLQGASVLDITPTLLYLMGLPVGQDMEGRLLNGMLEESLRRAQPVTLISSYHNFLIEPRRSDEMLEIASPLDAVPALLDVRE